MPGKFIPRGKMSKKARKELNALERATWDMNPATRRVESKKLYNRKRSPIRYDDDRVSFCRSMYADTLAS